MLKDTYCPIAAAAKVLQPKWNIQILRAICLYEVSTFNEIRRLIPNVSPTLVSARLKFLVEHGILEKRCLILKDRPGSIQHHCCVSHCL